VVRVTAPEPIRVPLPHGLCAIFVMREKPPLPPLAPQPTEAEAEEFWHALTRLTAEQRAAAGLPEQLELDHPGGAA
jgi:hypothetical protein